MQRRSAQCSACNRTTAVAGITGPIGQGGLANRTARLSLARSGCLGSTGSSGVQQRDPHDEESRAPGGPTPIPGPGDRKPPQRSGVARVLDILRNRDPDTDPSRQHERHAQEGHEVSIPSQRAHAPPGAASPATLASASPGAPRPPRRAGPLVSEACVTTRSRAGERRRRTSGPATQGVQGSLPCKIAAASPCASTASA